MLPIDAVARLVQIRVGSGTLEGMLEMPPHCRGMVLFAHGSGSSWLSPRNNYVAGVLREAGMGTLLIDLLTQEEDRTYDTRFDIALLTRRLVQTTEWLRTDPQSSALPTGYFGASTGAAAALQAAALRTDIAAIVSRGGRPDLAGEAALERVKAPTLLIVGGLDEVVIGLNEEAYRHLKCEKRLCIVAGATHLFEESGTLEEAARLATSWFRLHLSGEVRHA